MGRHPPCLEHAGEHTERIGAGHSSPGPKGKDRPPAAPVGTWLRPEAERWPRWEGMDPVCAAASGTVMVSSADAAGSRQAGSPPGATPCAQLYLGPQVG